jgi:hypothetical protein
MQHRRWSTLAPDHHQLRHRTFAQRAVDDAGAANDAQGRRDNGNSRSRCDEADCVGLGPLLHHARAEARRATQGQDLVVKTGSARSGREHERLLREHGEAQSLTGTKRVAGR